MVQIGDGADGRPQRARTEAYRPEGGRGESKGSDGLSTNLPSELSSRLRELGRRVPPAEISDVWIFPPLAELDDSGEFLLFTRFLTPETQRLCGVEFRSRGNGNGASISGSHAGNGGRENGDGNNGAGSAPGAGGIVEYGAVPAHRVPRVVAGVRKRIGDHHDPVHVRIGGSHTAWACLVGEDGASPNGEETTPG